MGRYGRESRWSNSREWRRTGLALAIPALALLIGGAGCGRKPETAEAGAPGSGGSKPADSSAAAVTAVSAKTGAITKSVEVTGSLVALQDVVVGTKQAGRVAQVNVHEGDPVSVGQVVAMMDIGDLNAQVQQAQANLQTAFTRLDQSRATFAQSQASLAQARNTLQNAVTTATWTDMTTASAVLTAQAGVNTAKERLAVVKEGARPQERQQAQESVASAKANYEKAKSDLKRYQSLYRDQVVAATQLDQMQAAFDAAQANYNSALQALSLIREGSRPQDIRQAELAVQQANEALVKAQADKAQVVLRKEDINTARVGVVSAQANLTSAKSGIATAQAGVDQAKAALKITQEGLGYAYVRSTVSGFVAERRAEPGTQLGGGGAILRIVNPATVYLQATLPESQYADVHVGQPVAVSIDALPETQSHPISGRVSYVLPVASAARNFTVRVDVAGDRRMRPQMFARGSILIDTHRSATLVQKDAVLFDATTGKARVFVVGNDGKAVERPVTVGFSNPKEIEILSGVKPGENVIAAGQSGLQNGDPVKVQ